MELGWGTIVKTINWTFVLNLINFAILLFVLNRVLYRPVIRVMEGRRARLAGQLKQAESRRHQAEELKAKREAELARARAEARESVEAARRAGVKLLKKERARALAEAHRIIAAAEAAAAREREELGQELRAELEELALASAAEILGRELR
jgi:F-type H+-transporting ATPase subunit b